MNSMARMLLLVLMILLVIALFPAWPYSAGWGYYPSGGVMALLIIAVVLLFMTGNPKLK